MACILTLDEFYKAHVNFEKKQCIKAKKNAWAAWKEAKQKWQQDKDMCIALKDREKTIYAKLMEA